MGRIKFDTSAGQSESGQSMYRASCGHRVFNRKTVLCQSCWRKKCADKVPNVYIRRDVDQHGNTISVYLAACGHEVRGARALRCWECRVEFNRNRPRMARYNQYKRVPSGDERGNIPEHRLIAEQALGRRLRDHEVVHHINMDKHDNRRCNLLICDKAYHRSLHHRMELAFARRLVPPKE